MFEFPSDWRDNRTTWIDASGQEIPLPHLSDEERAELKALLESNADAIRARKRQEMIDRVQQDPTASQHLDKLVVVFDAFSNDIVAETEQMQTLVALDKDAAEASEDLDRDLTAMHEKALTRYIAEIPDDGVNDGYRWHVGSPANVYIQDTDGTAGFQIERVIHALEAIGIATTGSNSQAANAVLASQMEEGREGRTITADEPHVLVTWILDDDLRTVLKYGRTERVYVVFVAFDEVPEEVRAVAIDFERLRIVVPIEDDDEI